MSNACHMANVLTQMLRHVGLGSDQEILAWSLQSSPALCLLAGMPGTKPVDSGSILLLSQRYADLLEQAVLTCPPMWVPLATSLIRAGAWPRQ